MFLVFEDVTYIDTRIENRDSPEIRRRESSDVAPVEFRQDGVTAAVTRQEELSIDVECPPVIQRILQDARDLRNKNNTIWTEPEGE